MCTVSQQAQTKKKKAQSRLNQKIVAVLLTKKALEAKVTGLMTELSKEKNHKNHQSQLIERDLYKVLPDCKVHFFGSLITGLATHESDFDIYIDFGVYTQALFNYLFLFSSIGRTFARRVGIFIGQQACVKNKPAFSLVHIKCTLGGTLCKY